MSPPRNNKVAMVREGVLYYLLMLARCEVGASNGVGNEGCRVQDGGNDLGNLDGCSFKLDLFTASAALCPST